MRTGQSISSEYASRSTDGTSTIPSPEVGSTPRGASCVPFVKPGQLIIEHGKSRFIENNLWASVSDEFRPRAALTEYSDDEDEVDSENAGEVDFMFGITPGNNSHRLEHLHPTHENIFKLWQIFLDNINPMTKLIHQPTLHQKIVKAAEKLSATPKGLECLMFAIYTTAVFSLAEEECELKLGEPRKTLLARYRHGTRVALAKARYMGTSDLQVLQAFLLYLISMREDYDSRTLWTLSGVASRISQGMGLHRDGANLGLSPFETELRRRVWWQLSILDFRSAELSGSGRFGDFGISDTLVPSNVNDADMWPEMTEAPVSQTRPGEMVTCLLRCEFGNFWREKVMQNSALGIENIRLAASWKTKLEERDAHVDELESRLEDKFLRYCDPSVPLQFLATIIARGAVASMRLMAHHPRKYGKEEVVPVKEQELLWNLSIHLLEADNLVHSSKQLQRFRWHSNSYFVWQALIYVLHELQLKPLGNDADRGWQQVDEVFEHHPYFATYNRRPLLAAVGSLCIKAYAAREKALRESSNGVQPTSTPKYIVLLREQRLSSSALGTDLGQKDWELRVASDETNSKLIDAISDPAYHSRMPPQSNTEIPGVPPISQPFQYQPISADNIMYPSDPALAQDLALADGSMDWARWDALMEDFDMTQNPNNRAQVFSSAFGSMQ